MAASTITPLGGLSAIYAALSAIIDALDIDPNATMLRVKTAGEDGHELASISLAELMTRADCAIVEAKAQQSTAPRSTLVTALQAAILTLRSYQHGNTAPGLAKDVADACEAVLAQSEGR